MAQLEAAGLTVRVRGVSAVAIATGAHGLADAADPDVEAIKAPMKRFLRSGEKAVLDYKKPGLDEFDFEKMVDLDRGKFVCASLAAMERVLGALRPLSAGLQRISGFPDHAYCIEYAANRLKVLGDFMTNVSIYFRAGTAAEEKFVCELQVGLRRVETAREELGGHDAYDIIRSIEALEKALNRFPPVAAAPTPAAAPASASAP